MNEIKLKIPLGIDDYRVVSKECYYVDKTLLIKDIVSLPEESVTLFTRPRRFGKSLAISMLSTFFDEKIDNAAQYFERRKISHEPEYALLSSCPVIVLSLKDIRAATFSAMKEQIKDVIRREYARHDELISTSILDDNDASYYKAILSGSVEDTMLSQSLFRLTSMLHQCRGKKVCLFIDEYDTPIQCGYENGFYDEAIAFFRNFFGSALKGNTHLKTAVLTGILRIAKESLFSDLNNPTVDNGFDSAFSENFGFTRDEAMALCDYFEAAHPFEQLWAWYGGYCFSGELVMNPWSILSYFRFKKVLKEYWVNTSSVSLLSELMGEEGFVFSSLLGKLLNGESIVAKPVFSVSYADLSRSQDHFLGFLMSTGYLTCSIESENQIVLPNKETSFAIAKEVLERYRANQSPISWLSIKQSIINADTEAFSALLKRVLLRSFSYFDFHQERSYQAMALTLVSLLFEDCIVKSEVMEGEGRCDILIQPRFAGEFGAVIEIKHVKNKTSLSRLQDRAKSALKQIKEKEYAEDLFFADAKPILAYGIAFYQKSVVVEVEYLKR